MQTRLQALGSQDTLEIHTRHTRTKKQAILAVPQSNQQQQYHESARFTLSIFSGAWFRISPHHQLLPVWVSQQAAYYSAASKEINGRHRGSRTIEINAIKWQIDWLQPYCCKLIIKLLSQHAQLLQISYDTLTFDKPVALITGLGANTFCLQDQNSSDTVESGRPSERTILPRNAASLSLPTLQPLARSTRFTQESSSNHRMRSLSALTVGGTRSRPPLRPPFHARQLRPERWESFRDKHRQAAPHRSPAPRDGRDNDGASSQLNSLLAAAWFSLNT